jgi:hypothetical protein
VSWLDYPKLTVRERNVLIELLEDMAKESSPKNARPGMTKVC